MIHFELPGKKLRQKELQMSMAEPGFWDNIERANHVSKELKGIEDVINTCEKLNSRVEDVEVLIELCESENDESVAEEIENELNDLQQQADELHLQTLLKGQYDHNDAILTLHAGAGGTEAQDWTSMLYRMYSRYCQKKGYALEVLDYLDGEEAGIKSITFQISGPNAYGYLKTEKGVHRLVRISPFDSNARRHTSFASLEVMPVIEDDDTDIVIRPEDIRVDTYRASGAGGQHINKTSSAVRITHMPTGFVVQCQNERSQVQNKETAMKMLKSKLIEQREQERMDKLTDIKGEIKKIEWGSQIRSYVFHPYSMVKDHRTDEETSNVQAVMDGEIDAFINSYLSKSA